MTSEDIDALKRTRDALAASEARLARVLKGSDDGWWDWDLETGTLYYSPRWWSMLGMEPDALPADQALWERLLHPEDKARVDAVFLTALAQGPDQYAVEFRLRHADGHWVPVLSRGHILRTPHGRACRVSGSNIDLTARHKAEADLRRSEEQQRFIIDHLVAGLLVLGRDGSLRQHNPRAAELLGGPLPLHQPGWLQELPVLREDGTPRPPEECLFERALRSDGPMVQGVFGLIHPGKAQPVWLLASGVAERSPEGAIQQVLITFVDITERRRAEQQHRQSEASLRNLLEAMGDGVFVAQDGRFVFLNPAMPAMLGHTVGTMLGLPFDKVIDPVSMPQWTVRYLQRIGSGSEPLQHYEVYMTPRGGGISLLVDLRAHRTTFGGRPAVMGIVRNIDEQRRTEIELRSVQAFAKATLDGLTAQICVLDASGDIVSTNLAWDADHTPPAGAEPAVERTVNYLQALPRLFDAAPAQTEALAAALRQVLAGTSARGQTRVARRHGAALRWFDVRITRGSADGPLRVVVAHEDVTEQILSQKRIEALHERLALALDGAGYGVWEYDLATGLFEWNAQMLAMHGHTAETFPGTREAALATVHPDDLDRVRDAFEALVAGGPPMALTCRIRRFDDGRERCLEVIGRLQTAFDGSAPRLVGINRDITAARDAEAALRASEQRWKFALEGAGDGVWDHDLVTGEMLFSRQWKELLGHDEHELGSGFAVWRDRVHADDLPDLEAAMAESLQGGGSFLNDHRLRCKDGSWKWVHARGLVVARDAAGRPLRMVGTHADLSERRRAESARVELQAQLREAQKMEAIGTLAGGVAHDFNNVLAGILGNVALAQQDLPAGHPAAASVEQIRQAGLRARALVQQILAFSRRQPQQMSAQALAPRVEEAVALLRATVPSSVRIDAQLADEPLHVMTDPTQMQQVLMNLCTNAWHALQGRPGHIVVGLEAVDLDAQDAPLPHGLQPGRHAHLWVRDDGCGMDADTLTRIFDPFFTTKPVGQGTGLGLSVAHGIVHAHAGAMTVESTPGVGSCFHLYLPLVAPRTVGIVQPASATLPGNGEQILYIDDDELMTITVEQLLQRAGYKVQVFTDAREALAELRSAPERFDLVVSDFNMPNLSGIDVAREVVALRPSLPVIISSGYISEALRRDAKLLGVRALMKKERTVEELHGLVQRVLGQSI